MTQNTQSEEMHELALGLEGAAEGIGRGKPATAGLLFKAARMLHTAAERIEKNAASLQSARSEIAKILSEIEPKK